MNLMKTGHQKRDETEPKEDISSDYLESCSYPEEIYGFIQYFLKQFPPNSLPPF